MNENEKNAKVTISAWLEEQDKADLAKPSENVLQEAQRIIYGDREKTYGKPSKNLETIAKMWSAYLGEQLCFSIQPKDVAVMMILLKAARLSNHINHRDSVVDICGYAALIERCDE
jgi:hypothetical protein